jgi:hypothetical protein
MAVRNGAPFLEAALASLAAQDFEDFEIILVDNGSRDRTVDIIADWTRREPRLRPFRLEHPGLARSLRYAASLARAPLLARLDSDDIALPSRLRMQHAAMVANPSLGLLGTAVEVIDLHGQTIGERRPPLTDDAIKRFLTEGNPFVHSSMMMRRDAYDRAGGYREGLRLCEDFDLWCRMAEVTEVANLAAPLVRYRLHGGCLSFRQASRMALTETCIIAARRARHLGEPEPFDRGMPKLRHALGLLGVRREEMLHRALKAATGSARLALEFGERARSRRVRRRAYRLLFALPIGRISLSGAGHIFASYFRRYSRPGQQALRDRLFGQWLPSGRRESA